MSKILMYGKYLLEAEQSEKQNKIISEYKKLYLEAKEDLRKQLGDKHFSGLMSDCMKAEGFHLCFLAYTTHHVI